MTTKTIFALLMVFLLAAVAVNAEVYINEVMVNPSEGNDFVELYNDGETVSLDNWTIRDADDVLKTFGTEDTITDYVVIDVSNKLINSGNSVSLYNADILIDKINYGSVEEDNVTHLEAPEEDEVLVRVHDGNENWTISSTATPGAINNRVPVIGEPEDDITGSSENVTLNIVNFPVTDADEDEVTVEAFVEAGVLEDLTDFNLVSNEDGTYNLSFTPSFNFVKHPDLFREFELTIKATDDFGGETNVSALISVSDLNQAPTIDEIDTLTFIEKMEGSFTVTTNDADGDNVTYFFDGAATGMSVNDEGVISWQPAVGQEDVTNVLLVVIDHPYGEASGKQGSQRFNATVTDALAISNVKVNGDHVESEGTTTEIGPEDEMSVSFQLTNNLNRAITGIEFSLSPLFSEFNETVNLDAGETDTVTLTKTLPLDITENEVATTLYVTGEDLEDRSTIPNNFQFTTVVERDAANIAISELNLNQDNVTCGAETTLSIDFANRGDNNEDDIVITVTGPNEFEETLEDISLNAGEEDDKEVTIPTSTLNSGSNTFTVTLTYRSGFFTETDSTTLLNLGCLGEVSPTDTTIPLANENSQEFSITLSEEGASANVAWNITKDGESIDTATGLSYLFRETETGNYQVTVSVNEAESNTWQVKVTDVPIADDLTLTIDDTVTVENNFGKIEFTETVNFGDLVDLDKVIKITDGQVAIDTSEAPQLDKSARVTIKKMFDLHQIQVSDNFGEGPFNECTACDGIINADGEFTFNVPGFSTYKVVEVSPADLNINTVDFTTAERGTTITVNVPLTNTGTLAGLTNVAASTTIDDRYSPVISNVPTSIAADTTATAQLSITLSEDADGGRQKIGTFTVTSAEDSETVDVFLETESALVITNIEINGKSSGDLKLDEENEIEIEVENTLDDVTIENIDVEILIDLGDDEVDESEEIDDLDEGDEDTATFTFNLADEDIETDSFTLEITVEGRAEDGSRHTTTEEKTVDLDLETHQLMIDRASVTPSTLSSSRRGSVQVTIKNIGQKDEDEVKIQVSNPELGIDLNKDNIKIDKFTDSDNDGRVTFNFAVENEVAAGTYPIEIEVFIDGDLEDSTNVDLTVSETSVTQSSTQQQNQLNSQSNAALAQQLQRQLEAQLATEQVPSESSTVKASFRESNTYTTLLAVLVVLAVIAMILLIGLMMRKR
ncbi:hypothetical protein HOI26_05725 [Candidatus Woesearchaeota archaeon]|jgi:hypothetical protein|nr:hypothetical protein [Candidatus Woesearchaeota archaeon]MBT5740566.1 hypothetical protein [Candidatus Woesearchaeota archaeon]